MLSDAADANKIVHFSEWTSIADARAFFEPARLGAIQAQADVRAPEFLDLEPLEAGTL